MNTLLKITFLSTLLCTRLSADINETCKIVASFPDQKIIQEYINLRIALISQAIKNKINENNLKTYHEINEQLQADPSSKKLIEAIETISQENIPYPHAHIGDLKKVLTCIRLRTNKIIE
jgi:hypothetical protein